MKCIKNDVKFNHTNAPLIKFILNDCIIYSVPETVVLFSYIVMDLHPHITNPIGRPQVLFKKLLLVCIWLQCWLVQPQPLCTATYLH